jgi:hypothetical protein
VDGSTASNSKAPLPCEVQLGPVLARSLRWCEVCVRIPAAQRFWAALGAQWSVHVVVSALPLVNIDADTLEATPCEHHQSPPHAGAPALREGSDPRTAERRAAPVVRGLGPVRDAAALIDASKLTLVWASPAWLALWPTLDAGVDGRALDTALPA